MSQQEEDFELHPDFLTTPLIRLAEYADTHQYDM